MTSPSTSPSMMCALVNYAKATLSIGCAHRSSSNASVKSPIEIKRPVLPRILGSKQPVSKLLSGDQPAPQENPGAHCTDHPRCPSWAEPCPEPSPLHTHCQSTPRSVPEPVEEPTQAPGAASLGPPVFRKPTRYARACQLQARVREYCELSFDEVDVCQQSSLTCRMLTFAKSLRCALSHWDEGGVRGATPAFQLIGLSEADMQAVDQIVESADDLVAGNQIRKAYDQLSRARSRLGLASNFDPKDCLQEQASVGKLDDKPVTDPATRSQGVTPKSGELAEPVAGTQTDERKGSGWGDQAGPSYTQHKVWDADVPSRGGETVRQSAKASRQGEEATGRARGKYLCRYRIGIEEDSSFKVCRRVIGPGGENMKRIVDATGKAGSVKIRLRGKGSKYLEGPLRKESADDLMLCISAPCRVSFEKAAHEVETLLYAIHDDYQSYCKASGMPGLHFLEVRRQTQRSH